jgi:DNA mismatch endonuclease (patch repair protein)
MRSRNMAAIKGRDTKPELTVRKMLHRLGYRFRLHRRDLPGTPDIVLPKYRTVIFVHGCFWHRHPGCRYTTTPTTRKEYWEKKFSQNVERDSRQKAKISSMGWQVLVIWECQLQSLDVLAERLDLILKDHSCTNKFPNAKALRPTGTDAKDPARTPCLFNPAMGTD